MARQSTVFCPPYEEQNARISILVNGIAERPDTFVQTVLGQLQKPLADGAGNTFSTGFRDVFVRGAPSQIIPI